MSVIVGSTNLQGTPFDQRIDSSMYFDRFLWNDLQHPGYLQSYTSKLDHRGFEVWKVRGIDPIEKDVEARAGCVTHRASRLLHGKVNWRVVIRGGFLLIGDPIAGSGSRSRLLQVAFKYCPEFARGFAERDRHSSITGIQSALGRYEMDNLRFENHRLVAEGKLDRDLNEGAQFEWVAGGNESSPQGDVTLELRAECVRIPKHEVEPIGHRRAVRFYAVVPGCERRRDW